MIPEPDPHQGRGLITSVYIFFLFNKLFIFKDAVEFLYQPKGSDHRGKVKCLTLSPSFGLHSRAGKGQTLSCITPASPSSVFVFAIEGETGLRKLALSV